MVSPDELTRRTVLKAAGIATGGLAVGSGVGTVAARKNNVGFVPEEDFDPRANSFEILGRSGESIERAPNCADRGRERTHLGWAFKYEDGREGTLYVDARKQVEPGRGYNWVRSAKQCGDYWWSPFLDVGPDGRN